MKKVLLTTLMLVTLQLAWAQGFKNPVREEFDYVKRNAPANSYHSLGLPMGWMSLCNPDYSKYSLTERKGFLRLRPSTIDLSETASPTFVARR